MNHFLNRGHYILWNDYLWDRSNTQLSSVWHKKKKKEIEEIQTMNASPVLHGGQENPAAHFHSEMKGCWVSKLCIPGVSRKIWAAEMKKWAEAIYITCNYKFSNKILTKFTLLMLNLFFGFHFTSFVHVCLHFFFYPSWNSFKIKILCQLWIGTGKGKRASFL